MITLGQTLGTLSLVLNSVRDGGDPDAEPSDDVEPAETPMPSLEVATGTLLPRQMTLDSDVTSLLARQLAAKAESLAVSPVPPSDRTTKVQVVRGVQTQAVQLGVEAVDGETPVAEQPSPAAAAE